MTFWGTRSCLSGEEGGEGMAWVCGEPGEFVKEKFGVPENSFVWLVLRCKVKRGQKVNLKR